MHCERRALRAGSECAVRALPACNAAGRGVRWLAGADDGSACRYRKGLPPTVMRMNEECLRLRPHDHPGYQTVQEIRNIVSQAIGPNPEQRRQRDGGLEDLVDQLALDDSQYF